jgi:hypothetical protein
LISARSAADCWAARPEIDAAAHAMDVTNNSLNGLSWDRSGRMSK